MLRAHVGLWEDEAPRGCRIILQDYEFPEEKAWENPILGILSPPDIPPMLRNEENSLENSAIEAKPPGFCQEPSCGGIDAIPGQGTPGMARSGPFPWGQLATRDGTRCPLKCER